MENVKFLFSKEDTEMKEDLLKTFGEEVSISEEFELIGAGDAIVACVIPATALTVQIIDFILTHLVNSEESKNNNTNQNTEQRKVEINGQRITLVGYSAEEIKTIVSALGLKKK